MTRITPACAGNTIIARAAAARFEDHPRVCGEYLISLPLRISCLGSPPRVRGILFQHGKDLFFL